MEKEFKELKEFLCTFWSYKKGKITVEKSLDDLGMYGDDKREFLMSFIEKFNIEASGLDYDKFCESEIFNPMKLFSFKKREKIEINIGHLIDIIKKKKWIDPL